MVTQLSNTKIADTYLFRNKLLVDNNFKDKLLEPVRGHEKVTLLAPVLAPAVLHPPAGHGPVLFHVTTRQDLDIEIKHIYKKNLSQLQKDKKCYIKIHRKNKFKEMGKKYRP